MPIHHHKSACNRPIAAPQRPPFFFEKVAHDALIIKHYGKLD